jgi:hypothetical protein
MKNGGSMLNDFVEILTTHRISREIWDPRQANLGADRRVFHRVPIQAPCRLIHSSFGLESAATVMNLSLGGVGVLASVNWSEGSRIRVRLEELGLEVSAIIVFRREEASQFRYGVKFQQMGLLEIVRLRRFLQKHHQGRLTL